MIETRYYSLVENPLGINSKENYPGGEHAWSSKVRDTQFKEFLEAFRFSKEKRRRLAELEKKGLCREISVDELDINYLKDTALYHLYPGVTATITGKVPYDFPVRLDGEPKAIDDALPILERLLGKTLYLLDSK